MTISFFSISPNIQNGGVLDARHGREKTANSNPSRLYHFFTGSGCGRPGTAPMISKASVFVSRAFSPFFYILLPRLSYGSSVIKRLKAI
jgi:hypothetical protein